MAHALHKAGIPIRHILVRNPSKARALAAGIGASVQALDLELHEKPDLILLCVSDDALPELCERFESSSVPLVHCSGSTPMDSIGIEGGQYGVFYPLQTFTAGVEMEYRKIPFLIEASSEDLGLKLRNMAGKISDSCIEVNSASRLIMHMAAVFACNFSNHMTAIAERLLSDTDLDLDLLRPLIQQTFTKLTAMDPLNSQTGPALRGDSMILQKHLEILNDRPKEQEIYKLISENIFRYRKQ